MEKLKLGRVIRKDVFEKERFFNDYLDGVGRVFLDYKCRMNDNREIVDRFRILLYSDEVKGKHIFYSDGLSMAISYESMAKQLKEYCKALEKKEITERECRKAWREIGRMHYFGLNLIKVDLSRSMEEMNNQIGNNILAILEERYISIREMSIDMNLDYAGLHRLVNKDSLENVTLKKLLEVAEYLKVDVQDLYK